MPLNAPSRYTHRMDGKAFHIIPVSNPDLALSVSDSTEEFQGQQRHWLVLKPRGAATTWTIPDVAERLPEGPCTNPRGGAMNGGFYYASHDHGSKCYTKMGDPAADKKAQIIWTHVGDSDVHMHAKFA